VNQAHGFEGRNIYFNSGNAVAADFEVLATNWFSLRGFEITQGGLTISGGRGAWLSGGIIEHRHDVTPIWIGRDPGGGGAIPQYDTSIKNLTVSRGGSDPSSKPTIFCQLSSTNISIENFNVQALGSTGAHTSGWIEIAEVFNVRCTNISARDMNATVSPLKLIYTSSVGPDWLTLENIYEADNAVDTGSVEIRADNLLIRNSNVDITIKASSTNVQLENCTGTITDASELSNRILNGGVVSVISTLADDATPSISAGGKYWLTGGTTTITDIDDGITGQEITIIAEHSLSITDGTNIFLSGSVNFSMTATDTLTLVQKADGKWYEVSRGDNGA
jgi:hypothetical protein